MQTVELNERKISFQVAESYKILRSNVEFSGENVRVICLTSAIPNDGKSTTSFELAKSFAQSGKSTLLIDADLRKSVMKKVVTKGSTTQFGLSHLLIGKASFMEAVCETDIPNFSVIFSGPFPPNPSELLGSQRFHALIEEAKASFDYIIIDTPPIGSVIDSAVISRCCDGVVLVMRSGAVSYRFAQRIKAQMENAGAKILGCVLNGVDMSGKGYGKYGKYGRYYQKYYGAYYGSYSGTHSEK